MKLAVAERIQLLQILPTKGDFATAKILSQLRLGLGLTEDEFKEWGVRNDPEAGMIHWDKNGVAEIPIGEVATGIVVDTLRDLDKKKELPVELIEMYEKFIPTTE